MDKTVQVHTKQASLIKSQYMILCHILILSHVGCGIVPAEPDFTTDRGLDVYLFDHDVTIDEVELVTDLTYNKIVALPHYGGTCMDTGIDGASLRVRDFLGMNGQYVYDENKIRVEHRDCFADTAFAHELGHLFQWGCVGFADYLHEEKTFWIKNSEAELEAQQILCQQNPPLEPM